MPVVPQGVCIKIFCHNHFYQPLLSSKLFPVISVAATSILQVQMERWTTKNKLHQPTKTKVGSDDIDITTSMPMQAT